MINADPYWIVFINFFTTGSFLLYVRNALEKSQEFQDMKKSDKWLVAVIVSIFGYIIASLIQFALGNKIVSSYMNSIIQHVSAALPFFNQLAEPFVIFIGLKLMHTISKMSSEDNIIGKIIKFVKNIIDGNETDTNSVGDNNTGLG